jgi:hypothetical protein
MTWGGFGRPLLFIGVRRIDRPSLGRLNNWEMTVYTMYMATMVVCLVAILIVFELIDQRPVK